MIKIEYIKHNYTHMVLFNVVFYGVYCWVSNFNTKIYDMGKCWMVALRNIYRCISVLCCCSAAYEIIRSDQMINYCYGCGEKIRETSANEKKSARIICDKCWNKSKIANHEIQEE